MWLPVQLAAALIFYGIIWPQKSLPGPSFLSVQPLSSLGLNWGLIGTGQRRARGEGQGAPAGAVAAGPSLPESQWGHYPAAATHASEALAASSLRQGTTPSSCRRRLPVLAHPPSLLCAENSFLSASFTRGLAFVAGARFAPCGPPRVPPASTPCPLDLSAGSIRWAIR